MILKADIDISTASGRKIARDLEKHKKEVKIHSQLPEGKTITLDEAYEKGLRKLSDSYGVDMHKLK